MSNRNTDRSTASGATDGLPTNPERPQPALTEFCADLLLNSAPCGGRELEPELLEPVIDYGEPERDEDRPF